jgi:hypothetical protein
MAAKVIQNHLLEKTDGKVFLACPRLSMLPATTAFLHNEIVAVRLDMTFIFKNTQPQYNL